MLMAELSYRENRLMVEMCSIEDSWRRYGLVEAYKEVNGFKQWLADIIIRTPSADTR